MRRNAGFVALLVASGSVAIWIARVIATWSTGSFAASDLDFSLDGLLISFLAVPLSAAAIGKTRFYAAALSVFMMLVWIAHLSARFRIGTWHP